MRTVLYLVFAAVQTCGQTSSLSGSFLMPLEDDAIQYATATGNDPVGRLQERIDRGEATLDFRQPHGYLLSVLEHLNIPVSSQTLVFSKTSFQQSLIHPASPRAVFFNDDAYIGWVRRGEVIEVSAVDPRKGGVFYTLDQRPAPRPRFVRHDECLQCHASPKTLGVPGHLVRSVFADREGFPQLHGGSFHTDHSSPFAERFGGWYITGTHGKMRHMGNAFADNKEQPDKIDRDGGANWTAIEGRFDVSAYPSPHSDLVAHMVLSHQTALHNLLTRVNYETRVALSQQEGINKALGRPPQEWSDSTRRRIFGSAEVLVRNLLLAGEAQLREPIAGTSTFARDFPRQGPRDKEGRSLRDFDLKVRLFRYPCSFLVYSEAFDQLTKPARDYVIRRMGEILSGQDQSKEFASLAPAEREAVREILLATKPEFREHWGAGR
jgi:hypothetical protein